MNDRFEFRGLCRWTEQPSGKKKTEWMYGYLLWWAGSPQIWTKGGHNFIVDPETVGQSTGLKDKNGNLIYEGDILKYSKCDGIDLVGRVKFYKAGFSIFREGIEDCSPRGLCGIEVIGNIHENPEQLN